MFSQEFFIQRSFEVVWAVFRVAEHTTRAKIRQGLEDKATDYLLNKDLKSLDELEQIVRLASQIKEVSQVNAGVLLREIGNLRAAMIELANSQVRRIEASKTPENAPQIEEVFSRPPIKVSDLIDALKTGFKIEEKKEEKESGNPSASSGQESGKSPAIRQSADKSPARETRSPASKKDRFEAVVGFKERNEAIMEILSRRNLCHIKDIVLALPNVSERTIRYDIQRLVDKGVIERVGTGGPNSFFRVKKEANSRSGEVS